MTNVAVMDKVERPVAHDNAPGAWTGADGGAQFIASFDFAPVIVVLRVATHFSFPERKARQVLVAGSVEAGSHSCASRQSSMFLSMVATPSYNSTGGS